MQTHPVTHHILCRMLSIYYFVEGDNVDKLHLKTLRLKYRLSQKQLARKSGLKLSRIIYLEHDFNKATVYDLEMIAKALDVEIKDLL